MKKQTTILYVNLGMLGEDSELEVAYYPTKAEPDVGVDAGFEVTDIDMLCKHGNKVDLFPLFDSDTNFSDQIIELIADEYEGDDFDYRH